MFYITGDTHGDFSRYLAFADKIQPTEQDVMIVLLTKEIFQIVKYQIY